MSAALLKKTLTPNMMKYCHRMTQPVLDTRTKNAKAHREVG